MDRRLGQEGRWRLHMAFRGLNAVGLHKPDRFRGGQMPAFRVRRAQCDRRNAFTGALELLAGHDPRLAPVSAVEGPWPKALSQTPIQRVFRHPIELRGVTHHLTSFWTAQRQGTQPSPSIQEGFGRDLLLWHRSSSWGDTMCRERPRVSLCDYSSTQKRLNRSTFSTV